VANYDIWLLGEPDNAATQSHVEFLQDKFPNKAIAIIAIRPSVRRDFKRLTKSLRNSGAIPAIRRVTAVLRNRLRGNAAISEPDARGVADTVASQPELKLHWVESFSSDDCLNIVRTNGIKFLLSATDTIIPTRLIQSIPFGIWNAHPGALPSYRGLGAADRMIADGLCPVVSLHLIDEGIDTGPLLIEREIDMSGCSSRIDLEERTRRYQSGLFFDLINLLDAEEPINLRDTFLSPSLVTHQNDPKIRKLSDQNRESGNLRAYRRSS
jgi:methionyl-tRNA formyltransferase